MNRRNSLRFPESNSLEWIAQTIFNDFFRIDAELYRTGGWLLKKKMEICRTDYTS